MQRISGKLNNPLFIWIGFPAILAGILHGLLQQWIFTDGAEKQEKSLLKYITIHILVI